MGKLNSYVSHYQRVWLQTSECSLDPTLAAEHSAVSSERTDCRVAFVRRRQGVRGG